MGAVMEQERYLGRIRPDMDVCDINGDKIGTVDDVHREELLPASTEVTRPAQDYIEVKTGLLGLGKRLYIPLSAVQDSTAECVIIANVGSEVDAMGWDHKPEHIDEVRYTKSGD
jgi:hypothetical protein